MGAGGETRPDSAVFTFGFAAQLPNIDRACREVERFLGQQGAGGDHFEIFLVLRELLNNAVIHGSRCDPNKRVRLQVQLAQEELTVEIEDQGPGFAWHNAPSGSEADSNACSGRGLHIAAGYTDSFEYNPAGNRVRFTKRVQRSPEKYAEGHSEQG